MTTRVTVSTSLDAPPDAVWAAIKRPATIVRITPGPALIDTRSLPEELHEGQTMNLRLRPVPALPAWRHHIAIRRVDDDGRVLQTQEHGGVVRQWDHTITVEPRGSGSRYTDSVIIDAGVFTPAVRTFAQGLYRARQRNLRRLGASLGQTAQG